MNQENTQKTHVKFYLSRKTWWLYAVTKEYWPLFEEHWKLSGPQDIVLVREAWVALPSFNPYDCRPDAMISLAWGHIAARQAGFPTWYYPNHIQMCAFIGRPLAIPSEFDIPWTLWNEHPLSVKGETTICTENKKKMI